MGLEFVEVMMATEDFFAVEIPEDGFGPGIKTVQDYADLVYATLQKRGRREWTKDKVTSQVIKIIENHSSRWFKEKVAPEVKLTDVLSM